jgi:hypothetical protein
MKKINHTSFFIYCSMASTEAFVRASKKIVTRFAPASSFLQVYKEHDKLIHSFWDSGWRFQTLGDTGGIIFGICLLLTCLFFCTRFEIYMKQRLVAHMNIRARVETTLNNSHMAGIYISVVRNACVTAIYFMWIVTTRDYHDKVQCKAEIYTAFFTTALLVLFAPDIWVVMNPFNALLGMNAIACDTPDTAQKIWKFLVRRCMKYVW